MHALSNRIRFARRPHARHRLPRPPRRRSLRAAGRRAARRRVELREVSRRIVGEYRVRLRAARACKSAMLSRVGNDHMGRFLTETLEREGCDVSHVRVDHERLTALVLLGLKDRDTFPLIFYRENCADMAVDEARFRRSVHRVVEGAADHRHALLDRAGEPHEPPRARLRAPQPGAHRARHRLPPGAVGPHRQGRWRDALRRERRRHRAPAGHPAAVRSRDRHRGGVPHRRRQGPN